MDWRSPLSVLFPPVQGAVLHAMWRRPVPMTGRAVHLTSGTGSYPGTLNALSRLVEQGLVFSRPVGAAFEFTLNTEHVLYPVVDAALGAYRPAAELDRRLVALVKELLGKHAKESSVAYFGSYARGEATAESDIDLLLVLPEALSDAEEEHVVSRVRDDLQLWTGNEGQIYSVRPSGLAEAVAANDPIVESWDREVVMVAGQDLRRRLRQLRSIHDPPR